MRTFVRQDLCVRHRDRHEAPSNRAEHVWSSDEDADGNNIARRVGRPRLSSLNRATSTRSDGRPTDIGSGIPQSDSVSLKDQLSTSVTLNVDDNCSIDMFNPNSTSLPAIRDFGRTEQASRKQEYSLSALTDINESPGSVRDEFTAWLFDEHFLNPSAGPFANAPVHGYSTLGNDSMNFGNMPLFTDFTNDAPVPDYAFDFDANTTISDLEVLAAEDVAWLSSSKRTKLIDLVRSRFVDSEYEELSSMRQELFQDDIDGDDHVLSLRSMQLYLGSYWKHFHRQMPILHQPTFSADSANDLLVLAVMAIGASQLGARHGRTMTISASKFATYIAWHLRWQIFMHPDFRPPAKLWVFQALVLLGIFEKQCSTRQMHERAHVHSSTMINLMRRGMTLVGEDETARRTPGPTTPDEAWYRWVETESTRRAAFAAFVIDAMHAEMFGHAAIMVVHELRLPLPCDDALWSATSAAEVGRIHASLHTHGIKPTVFLDGLKRILTGKKVKTNTFGRTILMAGLLSITWHLYQRDLQVSSLGASSSLGMPGIWREALTKSFDFWKRDFDESMSHMKNGPLSWHQTPSTEDRDAVAHAGILHHFSHVALHVDITDLQIFAGAQKLFGRTISKSDHDRAKHKMIEWVRTSAARGATFHSIQILKPIVMATTGYHDFYNTRHDYLIYRAWAIYHALLVVWAYGYAMDGVLRPFPSNLPTAQAYTSPDFGWASHDQPFITDNSFQARLEDARSYLTTIGNVKSPDDLRLLQTGRNRVVGLLGLFTTSFRDARWELLLEAASKLERTIQILRDGV